MLVAVVEDDPIFAETLGQSLEDRGFRVDVIGTGAAALRRFERRDLDAAIVDMGLPDMDGVEVIARARDTGMWAPILVATARVALDDMVRALEVGADDYVIKPCSGVEVAARLGALGRRAAAPRWAQLACGKVVLGAEDRYAVVDGRSVNLSPRQHALLELLLRRSGQIVSRAGDPTGRFRVQVRPRNEHRRRSRWPPAAEARRRGHEDRNRARGRVSPHCRRRGERQSIAVRLACIRSLRAADRPSTVIRSMPRMGRRSSGHALLFP